MPLHLHLHHQVATAVRPSAHVRAVAAMFGIGLDHDRPQTIVPPTDLSLGPGQLVLVTGPSGSGKSTVLRLIEQASRGGENKVLGFDSPAPPADRALVDQFPGLPLEKVLKLLSRAGLNDAFVMLRRPTELSDGQRYRFDLARCFALAQEGAKGESGFPIVLADEFGATLDRTTAGAIAAHTRKWVTAWGLCMVLATTHDDLLEPLAPDVLIDKGLGESMQVYLAASG